MLVIGVAVIGAILVGMVRSQQVQQQQELEKKLGEAQQKLALVKVDDLIIQKDQLTQNKTQLTAQIADAKAKLAAPIDNIAATDVLLKTAHDYDVKIVNINSGGKTNSILAGNKFYALSFNLQLEGDLADIAAYVSNLKTLFPTSIVETYKLNIIVPTPTPASVAGSSTQQPANTPEVTPEVTRLPEPTTLLSKNTTANINLIIYDYKGNTNVE
jgi:hypothetical protein